jgi:galactose-1-phosphate uridylyltransferase
VLGLGTHGANFTPEVAYRKRNPLLEEYITTNRTRAERVHNKNKEKLVYVYSTLI